jgi:prepilin-type N-terminal cleavage/methylation domain-containing protein
VTRPDADAGFTMIELLVVLVIMPIVIGAIAAAIIISEQDSGVASSRLSDSASAQTISDYYVRDVQGAEYLTTNSAASSPVDVCVDSSASGRTLVLGLYRPATSSPASNLLSVGYWVTASGANFRLVRYSCDSSGAMTSQVPITNDLTSPSQVTVSIAPASFQTAAAAGWTPTSTSTASISHVTISLMEPGSEYAYSLQASPRVWDSSASGDSGPASGAALVSLGNVTVSNTANITVDGNVDINGTLTGTGLTAAPGHTITQNANVTDPLSYYLPTSVSAPGTGSTCTISATTPISAGTYACLLVVQSGGNAELGPGVYALQAGIRVNAGGNLTYAGPPGQGVLLYLPCVGSCSETAIFASTASVSLPPLNATQSQAASTPSTTALQNMWFWQAASDAGISKLIGNGQGGLTSGIAYAPSGTIDLSNSLGSDATGEIVAGTVKTSSTSSASFTITGQ